MTKKELENKKAELARLQAEIEEAESKGTWEPRQLNIFPLTEKGEIFDRLYKLALENYTCYLENGWEIKNIEEYVYEEVMQKMLGKDVFEHLQR